MFAQNTVKRNKVKQVNLSSGNFIYQKTDLYYGTDEDDGDLAFSKFYNSINEFEGEKYNYQYETLA